MSVRPAEPVRRDRRNTHTCDGGVMGLLAAATNRFYEGSKRESAKECVLLGKKEGRQEISGVVVVRQAVRCTSA